MGVILSSSMLLSLRRERVASDRSIYTLPHSRRGLEIGKMEFDEQEFLAKLDKVRTTEEFRALIDLIPLTAEDLAEIAQMEIHKVAFRGPYRS